MSILNDIFPVEIINAFGWTLIHSIWQAAVIAIILAIILISMHHLSSKIRYVATALALLTILCLSVATFFHYYTSQKNTGIMKEKFITEEATAGELLAENVISNNEDVKKISLGILDLKAEFRHHLLFLVTLWFLGITILSIKFIGGFSYTYRLKVFKSEMAPSHWQNKLKHLCVHLNINKPARLLKSSVVKIPMVIGYIKPAILLPANLLTGMPSHQIEAIILHELAHIYRKDYLFNFLQSIIEILYFYHPAIWWISRTMHIEREHCCDDIVVNISHDSLNYAKALAEIGAYSTLPIRSVVALTNSKNILLNRIKRITQQPEPHKYFSAGLFSTLVIVTTIITIAFAAGNKNYHQNEIDKRDSFINFDYSGEWWYPIIMKHNIKLRAFSNFPAFLETGDSNEINKDKRITQNATIIINAGNDYLLLTAPKVIYTIKDSTYQAFNAELKRFSKSDSIPIIIEKINCKKLKLNFKNTIDGTPYFSVTNLDKSVNISEDENKGWFPKKYSKPESLVTSSVEEYFAQKSLLSGEFQANKWVMGDSISTGSNINFKMWHGVELETNNLKFYNNKEVFETDLLNFVVLKNKIVINYIKNLQSQKSYSADEIYREGRFIRLVGNARFSTINTKIKANEIIVYQNLK